MSPSWTTTVSWQVGQLVKAADIQPYIGTSGNLDVGRTLTLFLGTTDVQNQTTGELQSRWVVPFDLEIINMWPFIETASTSGAVTFDVRYSTALNASSTAFTTLFTSSSKLPSIDAGANYSTANIPDVTSLSAEDVLAGVWVSKGSTASANFSLTIGMRAR